MVQQYLPGARVVKAFNTNYFVRFRGNGRPDRPTEEREAIFVSGNDEEAKGTVSGLI